jgi:hypothetical protein
MYKVLYGVATLGLFVCLLLSFERPAMAYVDPGSGLFVFQSISSIGVGVLFFMRRRLRALFRRTGTEDANTVQPNVAPTAHEHYEIDKAA